MDLSAPSIQFKKSEFQLASSKKGSEEYWLRRRAQIAEFWAARERFRAPKHEQLTKDREEMRRLASKLEMLAEKILDYLKKPVQERETELFLESIVYSIFDKYTTLLAKLDENEKKMYKETEKYERYLREGAIDADNEMMRMKLNELRSREPHEREQPEFVLSVERDGRATLMLSVQTVRKEMKNLIKRNDELLLCFLFSPDDYLVGIIQDRWKLIKQIAAQVKVTETSFDAILKRKEKLFQHLEMQNCTLHWNVAKAKEAAKIAKMSKSELIKHIMKGHSTLCKEDPMRRLQLAMSEDWERGRVEDVKFCERMLDEMLVGVRERDVEKQTMAGGAIDEIVCSPNRDDHIVRQMLAELIVEDSEVATS